MKLQDKVAIITGSARGIGKAIAMKFASEGASIVVTALHIEGASRAAEEIKSQGGTAIAVKADVANRAEVQNLIKTALGNFKAIHILVNCAGITLQKALIDMTEEDWDTVLDVNLKGTFNCTQAVLPHMMEQRYGKIINMSSVVGTGARTVGRASYGAAKAGVIRLTEVTALEAGPYGINANAIAPGLVVTDMTYTGRTKEDVERVIEDIKKRSALGRVGRPDDIANLALFLASEDSSWITGQVVGCDGGRHDSF